MRIFDLETNVSKKEIDYLKTFVCKWYYFIPFFGVVFLLFGYLNIMKNLSVTSRRFVRSKKYIGFISPLTLIAISIAIVWLFFWFVAGVLIYMSTGGTFNIEAATYIWLILLLLFLLFLVTLFTPILFRTQVEYGIACAAIALQKIGTIPDLIIGNENNSLG